MARPNACKILTSATLITDPEVIAATPFPQKWHSTMVAESSGGSRSNSTTGEQYSVNTRTWPWSVTVTRVSLLVHPRAMMGRSVHSISASFTPAEV